MTKQDDLDKKLEEAKRQREAIRKKLDDADEAVERINVKVEEVQKLRQQQKKLQAEQEDHR